MSPCMFRLACENIKKYAPESKLYSVQPPSIDFSFDKLELNLVQNPAIRFGTLVFPRMKST